MNRLPDVLASLQTAALDLLVLASAAAPPAPAASPPPGIGRGLALIMLLTAAGFAVVLTAALLLVLRRGRNARRRLEREHRRGAGIQIDPWAEAGYRARPEAGDPHLEEYRQNEGGEDNPRA